LLGADAFGPVARQNTIVGSAWWSKLLTMWKPGRKKKRREEKVRVPIKGLPPNI
jgi:hypothetical protein